MPSPTSGTADGESIQADGGFIRAIQQLDVARIDEMVAEGVLHPLLPPTTAGLLGPLRPCSVPVASAGVTQHCLDCALHEVATGERTSAECRKARLWIANLLVDHGADPDNRQHGCGGTPLHHTLAGGYIELVDFLLRASADVNASNRYGVHPLHIAVKREYTDCIQYAPALLCRSVQCPCTVSVELWRAHPWVSVPSAPRQVFDEPRPPHQEGQGRALLGCAV